MPVLSVADALDQPIGTCVSVFGAWSVPDPIIEEEHSFVVAVDRGGAREARAAVERAEVARWYLLDPDGTWVLVSPATDEDGVHIDGAIDARVRLGADGLTVIGSTCRVRAVPPFHLVVTGDLVEHAGRRALGGRIELRPLQYAEFAPLGLVFVPRQFDERTDATTSSGPVSDVDPCPPPGSPAQNAPGQSVLGSAIEERFGLFDAPRHGAEATPAASTTSSKTEEPTDTVRPDPLADAMLHARKILPTRYAISSGGRTRVVDVLEHDRGDLAQRVAAEAAEAVLYGHDLSITPVDA